MGFATVADFLRSLGDGMPGSGARGFGNVTMFRLKALPTAVQPLRRNLNGNTGWQQFIVPASGTTPAYLSCSYGTGSTQVSGASAWLTAADVGRVHIYLTRITPTPGVIETYLDTMQLGNVALSAYAAPASGVYETAAYDGTTAASAIEWMADLDFYDAPTATQIQSFLRAARDLGDLPTSLGTTETRHSLRDALSGQVVVDGQAAPAALADTNAAVAAYSLQKQGAPVVREYWNTNGARNYGLRNAASGNFFKTSTPGGVGGGTGPFTVSVQVTFEEAVTGNTQYLVSRTDNATKGMGLYIVDNTTIGFSANDSGTWRGITYVVPAALIGQSRVITATFTGSAIQIWLDETMVASLPCATYTPYSGAMVVGALQDGTAPAITVSIQAVSAKDATTSSAELIKHLSLLRTTGRLNKLPSASHHYDFTADVEAAGGPGFGVPSTIVNRAGSDPLTRSGAGTLMVSRKTERTFGFESAPTCNGFMPNATNAWFESTNSGHDGGSTSGKSVALLMRIDSQLINKPRELLSIGTATAQTMYIRSTGSNNIINAGWLMNGPAWAVTSNIVVSAGDLGRLMLMVTQWDPGATRARMWWRGTELLAATMTSWATNYGGVNNTLRLGHLQNPTFSAYFAEEITIFGALTYDGVWTQNQIRWLYDGVAAENDIIGIPGFTGHGWSFKQAIAANGGVLPASVPDLQSLSAMTKSGSPDLKPHYAHAPKWAA